MCEAYFLRPFLLGCRMEKSSISEESVSCRSNSWAEQDPDPFLRPFLLFEPILPFETRASSSLRFFIFLYCLTCTSSLLAGSTVLLKMTMVPDFFQIPKLLKYIKLTYFLSTNDFGGKHTLQMPIQNRFHLINRQKYLVTQEFLNRQYYVFIGLSDTLRFNPGERCARVAMLNRRILINSKSPR